MTQWLMPAIWMIILLLIIYRYQRARIDELSPVWSFVSFGYKVAFGFANYYIWISLIGHGDSLRYMHDSLVVYNSLFDDPLYFVELICRSSLDHVPEHLVTYQKALLIEWHVPEYHMVRLLAILNVFTLGNAWGNIVLLSFLIYLAELFLYRKLYAITVSRPNAHKYIFAILFLIPSTVFWSSGLLKEGPVLALLCLIGGAVIGIQQNEARKGITRYFLLLILSLIILYGIRNYVAVLCMINLVVLMLIYRSKRPVLIATLTTIVIAGIIGIFLQLRTGDLFTYLQSEQQYFLLSGPDPDYTFHTLDGTPRGMLMKIPYAINNILFRPNLFHSSSLFRVYMSIELILVLMTIAWLLLKYKTIKQLTPFGIISIFFLLQLLLIFGIMVTDADTLSRYRSIPIMFLLLITYIGTTKPTLVIRES